MRCCIMLYRSRVKQAPRVLFFLFSAFILTVPSYGQYGPGPDQILDGTPVPRHAVRDNDLLWLTTVWRRIDVRQKMNQNFCFPQSPTQGRMSLFEFIKRGLLEERVLTAYSPGSLGDNDMFTDPLNRDELLNILREEKIVLTPSLEDGSIDTVRVEEWIATEDIIGFDIKERWFIDAEKSVLRVGIIGIAPVQAIYDGETGEFRGTKTLFWLNYNEARYAMAKWPIYDRHNDLQYISYDDLFAQRKFDAGITKVSNVYDRSLIEYLDPKDALYQALLEHEKLRERELDMWAY